MDQIGSIFICYAEDSASNPRNVMHLAKRLVRAGNDVDAYNGQPFIKKSYTALRVIDEDIVLFLNKAAAVVLCLSCAFQDNPRCKSIAQYALDMKKNKKNPPEILFVIMQPHHFDGWLAHMIKDTVCYSAWTKSQVPAASEAVLGVVKRRRGLTYVENDIKKWEDGASSRVIDSETKTFQRTLSRSPSPSRTHSSSRAESPSRRRHQSPERWFPLTQGRNSYQLAVVKAHRTLCR